MKKPEFCFILPYFGKWPVWMSLFLQSCEPNQRFSWLLLGDSAPCETLPANVRFVSMSLAEVERRCELHLGTAVNLKRLHKLCDLKPFYGLLFSDLISDVPFWGHTDLDLAYGELDNGVPVDLSDCDIYTPYFMSCGHFQLYRNSEKVNRVGFEINGWKEALLLDETVSLTEPGLDATLGRLSGIRWVKFANYRTDLVARSGLVGATFYSEGNIIGEFPSGDEVYSWNSGRVTQTRRGRQRDFLYMHWYLDKSESAWEQFQTLKDQVSMPPRWFFCEGSFRPNLPESKEYSRLRALKLTLQMWGWMFKDRAARPLIYRIAGALVPLVQFVIPDRLMTKIRSNASSYRMRQQFSSRSRREL